MKKAILYPILLFISFQSFGWGQTGHRAVALVADQYLTPKAKAKIKEILGQETLSMVSTWMDEIRSDSTYNYATDWHYVTINTGQTYDQATKNPNGDVIKTLQRLIAELSSHTLNHAQEVEHIKMLVHLVGDIHQPLHVGCCDDQGGNKVKVKWFRNDTNLHTVWDSSMIDDTKLSFTELAQFVIKPDKTVVKTLQSSVVLNWADESRSLISQVYTIGDGNLGYKYAYKNLPVVKEQISKAGIRLAGVLNKIYG